MSEEREKQNTRVGAKEEVTSYLVGVGRTLQRCFRSRCYRGENDHLSALACAHVLTVKILPLFPHSISPHQHQIISSGLH